MIKIHMNMIRCVPYLCNVRIQLGIQLLCRQLRSVSTSSPAPETSAATASLHFIPSKPGPPNPLSVKAST